MKNVSIKVIIFVLLLPIISFANTLPVKDFFQRPQADQLRISPDGKYLAVRSEQSDKKQVYVLDRKTKEITQRFEFTTAEDEAGNFFWANDERLIVEMNRKVGALDQPARTGFYFAGNADGTQKIQLWPSKRKAGGKRRAAPRGFSIVDLMPQDSKNILVQMYDGAKPGIYQFNIYTGVYTLLEKGPKKRGRLVINNSGEPVLSIGVDEDDRNITHVTAKKSNGDWYPFLSLNTTEGFVSPIEFDDKNNKLIAFLQTDDIEKGIYSVNLDNKDIDLLQQVKGDANIERYIREFEFDSDTIVGIQREPDYPVIEFFDKTSTKAKIQASFEAAFPDHFVSVGSPTKDGKLAIVSVRSDQQAGQFYLYDIENNKLNFEMGATPWLNEKSMARSYPISFKARDGLDIKGYLTLPNGKQKNLPMVLLVHGGPYGVKDSWRFDPEAQFLANRGYAVLQINYRGSGGRGPDFEYDAYKMVGAEMQDDLTDATLWAVEQGYADKNRLCIYGGSYGGYAALMGVVKEPDLYKCAIGYVGLYDIDLIKKSDIWSRKSGQQFAREAWGIDDKNFVKERSPIFHLDKLKAAVMIVHGRDDQRVHVQNAYDLAEALDKKGHPYEYMVKPNEGHGFYDLDNRIELYTKMEQFLKKHIGN